MPHLKSAKKRVRQNEKARARNRSTMKALRTQVKKVLKAIKDGQPDTAKMEYLAACRQLDKCGTRGYIHANAAARTKSRLALRVAAAKPAAPAAGK
jgi:small subunit ribosomal protein S20